jgi:hypothetical protein
MNKLDKKHRAQIVCRYGGGRRSQQHFSYDGYIKAHYPETIRRLMLYPTELRAQNSTTYEAIFSS